jgi:tetratricopeptide (TPR) repeat protein/predicted Ser/Thr protein kinase
MSEQNPADRLIGSMAGPYRLTRRLGEGGMGVVYLAERVEDFERQAAVKLLLQAAPGEETARRFQAEKEALAALEHPNIARLLDAGATDVGIPYLAVEYVDGAPLDRWRAAHAPDAAASVGLALQILDAVGYAHRRLIVHCDLKFSNVLVTEEGRARLLDFGVAKLLNPGAYGFADPLTRTFRPLTPEFASPEQLSGGPITTATDLYAIGVILYGLLTGRHPFEDRVTQPVALLEATCYEEPEPPSRHAPGVDRDLDAIVLKALRKEAEARYAGAAAFAADLRAWREGRAVAAREGSRRYRALKFVRRNRGAAAAAAAALAALALGAVGVARESVRASRARTQAEARFHEVRRISNRMLEDFYEKVGRLAGATDAQRLLVARSVAHLDRLSADGPPDAALACELAEGYTKMAALLGSPYENNLGQSAQALATAGKAIALLAAPADGGDWRARLALVRARQTRGDVLAGLGRVGEALAEARAAAATVDALATERPRDFDVLTQAGSTHEALGDLLGAPAASALLDRQGARRELDRALAFHRAAIEVDPAAPRPHRALVLIGTKVADLVAETDQEAALALYQEAHRALGRMPRKTQEELPNRRLRTWLQRRLAEALAGAGRYDEAAALLAENVQALESILAIDPAHARAQWDLAVNLHSAGEFELARGRRREALARYEAVARLIERMPDLRESLQLQSSLGETLAAAGRLRGELGEAGRGEALTRRGLALLRRAVTDERASPRELARAAESFLDASPAYLQDAPFALACLERALAGNAGAAPDPQALLLLARTQQRLGRRDDAGRTARAALKCSISPETRRRLETLLRP